MGNEELFDEKEWRTCLLLSCLFHSADDLWEEPLDEKTHTITKQENPVTVPENLPVYYHCATFEFTWDATFLEGLNVTLMYVNENEEERELTPGNKLFVLSHEKGSACEKWRINPRRNEKWRISLEGSGLSGQSAEVKVRIRGGTWEWVRSEQAEMEFYSVWNTLFGYVPREGRYISTGEWARFIWRIISRYLQDRPDQDKENCFMEVIEKLQECNCRRLRMWDSRWARFSTYLGNIVTNYCLDFIGEQGVRLFSVAFQTEGISNELNERRFPCELQQAFGEHYILLSNSLTVSIQRKDRRWAIIDEYNDKRYTIKKDGDKLDIFAGADEGWGFLLAAVEADEIEGVPTQERPFSIRPLDEEFIEEIEERLREFLAMRGAR